MSSSYRDQLTATRAYAAVVAIAALLAWPVLRPVVTAPVPGPSVSVVASHQAGSYAPHGVGRGRARPDSAQHHSTPSTTFVAESAASAPVLVPSGTAPLLRSDAPRTVGVRLAPARAPPARSGC